MSLFRCDHIENNVCDSIIGMLLEIPRKNKANLKSGLNLVSMSIRKELKLIEKKERKCTYLPLASYTLSMMEDVL